MVQFWDEVGAYLDFTNPETVTWWKAGVTKTLLEYGIAATGTKITSLRSEPERLD
jgi:alpha-glucosidase